MIEELIQKIARYFDREEIPYMIIGGQAVLLYGTPRFTRDIDITLGLDTDQLNLIEKACGELGLKVLPDNPEDFTRDTMVLPAEEPILKIRVDFIFSFTQYEAQALGRVNKISINDCPVKFASCEDVIIHKMIASRAIDTEDIKNILLKHRTSIDLEYIREWLSEFNKISEYEGILEKFESLLK